MNYVNIAFKLAKFHEKSKKKYEKIIKKSINEFPSFLSTKHYYKRRKAFFINNINLKKKNAQSERKKETNLILSSIITKKNNEKSNEKKSEKKESPLSSKMFLEINSNKENKNKRKK